MTKEQIEAIWQDVYRMYEQSNPNIYPAAIQRLREPFDLAIEAIAARPEGVRSEPTAWAVFTSGTHELIDVSPHVPDVAPDIYIEPLYMKLRLPQEKSK